ncbi:hypothetical protein [Sulfurimonas diazotrophicus]|uniref:DUF3124 domain-containing protein n=1 Tax=Sulfurimonas diazotrophicus TaxID=3131939 RepID=A0ABZ3HC67_9BACT
MQRTLIRLLPLLIILLVTGCVKKPVPESVPDPMTEAYLLEHMQVSYPESNLVSIVPPSRLSSPRFLGERAAISTTFTVQLTLDDAGEVTDIIPTRYLLLFSLRATAWGGFKKAIDTAGKQHDVFPYTSQIRDGLYYDNFYISVPREWLEAAAQTEMTLLFLGPKGELTVSIPPVYPKALLHYIDSGAFHTAAAAPDNE